MSTAKLLAECELMESDKYSIVIADKGDIVYHYGDTRMLRPQYSIAKVFTATAIGIMIDRCLIDINAPFLEYLNIDKYEVSKTLNNVSIKNLMTNTTGNEIGYLFKADRDKITNSDYLEYILKKDLKHSPSTHYAYSNSNYYLLARIIESITRNSAEEFIIDNIFSPLDIIDYKFDYCPSGLILGATGLYLSTYDMAKLGIVYSNGGCYGSKKIISRQYIDNATSGYINISQGISYGYAIKIEQNCYYIPARQNQLLLVKDNKVIAINANVESYSMEEMVKKVKYCFNIN